MDQFKMEELMECFAYVEDPRVLGRSKHLFIDIIVLSICATLCGAEACTEIEEFGNQKIDWLRQYLDLPCGIPSHDTIGRVLSIVEPLQMESAFRNWVESMTSESKTKRISLDGKSVAGTERKFTKHPLHIVSAYSHELGLTLMQTEAKYRGAGEAEAALDCLKTLDLKGVTVMADAALSLKRIVEQVRVQEGDYIVPIKGNQKLSLKEMTEYFGSEERRIKRARSTEEGHDRKETRQSEVLPATKMSTEFYAKWPDVNTIIRVTRTREVENLELAQRIKDKTLSATKTREDITYYVSSRDLTAKEALTEVRSHWGIENKLHWQLDVAFREDQWKVRAKSLARSLALIRKIALNIIRTSKTKGSVKVRIKRAAWNNDFLGQLVFGK
jgi:predicted transposase YbfD/YdcC